MSDLKDLPGKLAGLFDELSAKVFKRSLDIPSIERLHVVTRKLAIYILTAAERKALEACKKLNDATSFGFSEVAKDIVELRSSQAKLEETLVKIDADLTGLKNELFNKEPIPPTPLTEEEKASLALEDGNRNSEIFERIARLERDILKKEIAADEKESDEAAFSRLADDGAPGPGGFE